MLLNFFTLCLFVLVLAGYFFLMFFVWVGVVWVFFFFVLLLFFLTLYMVFDFLIVIFFLFLNFFTFCMLFLVTGCSFIQMFIGLEGVGLASFFLIGFWFSRKQAVKCAVKAIIINRIGDCALLFAFALLIFI